MRIGIDAPPQVKVYRKELYATIQENQSAAMAAPAAAVKSFLQKMKPPEEGATPPEPPTPEKPEQ